jgi:hypothetical protein
MHCKIRTYGLWAITAPRGANDPRVFLEDRRGNWPVSLFQRAVGVRLHPTSVYRRSFARMGDWKGFFITHAPGAAQKQLSPLIRRVCTNLGAPRARVKTARNAEVLLQGATGHAVLWSKRIRLLPKPPHARLLARLYVKASPLGEASQETQPK